MATTLTVAGATTPMRTRWLESRRGLESSAGQSATCHYPTRFDPQAVSPNTMVRLRQNYGWQTSAWHANWVGLDEMIEPSSDSYCSYSVIPLTGGSKNTLPTKFTTRPTWSECSRGISNGPISAHTTRGISANASRRPKNLFESTLDASPSYAPSSHTSPTMTSSWHLC
jgi:hypothetical protein